MGPAAALQPTCPTLAGDPEQHRTLVDQVKALQRSAAWARREWNAFCDGNLEGIRDPARHPVE
eukprot:10313194-Alexandrium_andersonii.AAC.1